MPETPEPRRRPEEGMLSVLLVCTGNICRSPFAELLLRHQVPGLPVASCGIDALEGHPMDAQMARLLASQGVDASTFRARPMTPQHLQADLILTMTARQRAFLVREHPEVVRRTGLLGHLPELAALVGRHGGPLRADHVREWSRQAHPAGREIPDPFRRPVDAARRSAALLTTHVSTLAELLHRPPRT